MQRESERSGRPITILMADDDEDDRDLTRDALERAAASSRWSSSPTARSSSTISVATVPMPRPSAPAERPQPSIILLDLNMPRKDGREALAEIKARRGSAPYPGGRAHDLERRVDVRRAYDLGANSYITKPVTGVEARVDARPARRVLVADRHAAEPRLSGSARSCGAGRRTSQSGGARAGIVPACRPYTRRTA